MNAPNDQARQLVERLRGVRVGLREDLEVSRHRFRGAPCYVLRDPLTFQSHRLEPADYQIVVALDAARALGDVFADLVSEGVLCSADEERFYLFIFQLHRLGFLNLPLSDEKILYRRYRARQQARRSRWLMNLVFCQVPLWNPEAFLTRTAHLAGPLFSRWALLAWLLTLLVAAVAVAGRWEQFLQPLNGLLATRNLVMIWFLLILLKAAHEFGHAYACKRFGGHVPEMGAMLIVGTPCAYVDATASWGFARRSHRLIVGLAGMYVETWIAALAALYWALSEPGLLNAAAYNVIFLAGVTTILFNINPLMRYDGYYIASDLLEIPNLRPRSQQALGRWFRQRLLGLPVGAAPWSPGVTRLLLTFGSAALLYRVLVMLGISALLAAKLGMLGLVAAGAVLASMLWGAVRHRVAWLWFAEETAPVRPRAVAVSVLLLLGLPLGVGLLPVEVWSQAPGVTRYEHETVVRADSAGFLERVRLTPGQQVPADAALLELHNDRLIEARIRAREALELAEARHDILFADARDRAAEEGVRLAALREQVAAAERRIAALAVRSGPGGLVLDAPRPTAVGRFFAEGDPLATIASGAWQVQVHLTADQAARAALAIGDSVEFRPAPGSGRIPGVVSRLEPMVSRRIDAPAVTQAGGGEIVVSATGETRQPYLTVTVTLRAGETFDLSHGMTGQVGFRASHQPIGLALYRRLVRFVHQLRA